MPQLDIGLEVLYTKHNTAFKGPGVYAINLPKPAITVFDDQEVCRPARARFCEPATSRPES